MIMLTLTTYLIAFVSFTLMNKLGVFLYGAKKLPWCYVLVLWTFIRSIQQPLWCVCLPNNVTSAVCLIWIAIGSSHNIIILIILLLLVLHSITISEFSIAQGTRPSLIERWTWDPHFSECNELRLCCAHEGKTCTDICAQVLTRKNW